LPVEVYRPAQRHGIDQAVVLHFDDGRDMAIHAMKMQSQYKRYLPKGEDDA